MSIPSEKTIQLTVKCVVRRCVVVAVLLTDFLLLVFAFMQKKKKVVLISGEYQKCVFATELIFYYNLKNPMEEILQAFCQGNQGDADFWSRPTTILSSRRHSCTLLPLFTV